ncbi:MAG: HAMP domain-containing sensor histidine kinase [Candidatus Brevundimonas phytovorans]|nr:HAMP domain-containing sensor histidine kinase [Brevundimonas sp.]WEK57485.1 MAG: HAMP domain-containing sensor histidine kinase [Brevundimonas sp.]
MKPPPALFEPIRSPDAPDAREGAAVAAWHAGWAAAVGLTALAGDWLGRGGEATGLDASAALAMATPGLLGLVLLARDGRTIRAALLAAWGLAAVAASGLSGGLIGPLGGFVFMPLAAAVALGSSRWAPFGLLGAGAAAVVGLAATGVKGVPPAAPGMATVAALLTLGAAALAFRLSAGAQARRLAAVEAAVAQVETVLAGQPGLTLVLDASGAPLAAYGAAPAALPVDPLFDEGLVASVHAPDRPAVLAALARAVAGSEAQVRFAPRLALDRRILLMLRRQAATEPPRLIAVALDATLQHAREEGLDAARLEAEAQSAGKTRFLAHMSHELRTPLNAVIGFSDIMRQRLFGPVPDRYAEYADSIHTAGRHLLALINDVLDVSRIEADRYDLNIETFDVRETVSAALALVRVQADDKGVDLAAVLPPEAVSVAADRRAVKQMLLNLLSNAVKFTPSGGAVTVSAEALGGMLELSVADTGVGVAPEDLARLGRPYEQAGGAEQRAQGAGLGLSLVRALAELHQGTMSLDSTPGEGTAVTLCLPVVVARPAVEAEKAGEVIPLNRSA